MDYLHNWRSYGRLFTLSRPGNPNRGHWLCHRDSGSPLGGYMPKRRITATPRSITPRTRRPSPASRLCRYTSVTTPAPIPVPPTTPRSQIRKPIKNSVKVLPQSFNPLGGYIYGNYYLCSCRSLACVVYAVLHTRRKTGPSKANPRPTPEATNELLL